MGGGVLLDGGGGGRGLGVVGRGEGVLLLDIALYQPVRAPVVEVLAQFKQVDHGDFLFAESKNYVTSKNTKNIQLIKPQLQ